MFMKTTIGQKQTKILTRQNSDFKLSLTSRCATVFATELRLLPQMECYRKLEAINDRYKQRSEERTD